MPENRVGGVLYGKDGTKWNGGLVVGGQKQFVQKEQ